MMNIIILIQQISKKNDLYLNTCMNQGWTSIINEEAILISWKVIIAE